MLRLVLRRLALLIPTLLGLSILLFLWVRALPGGPATALLGERSTPEAVERINRLYGFDRPLVEQYLTWLGQLLREEIAATVEGAAEVDEEVRYLLRTLGRPGGSPASAAAGHRGRPP